MSQFMKHSLALATAVAAIQAFHASPVVVAPSPPGEPLSSHFSVTVDGQSAPVYIATVRCIEQVRTAAQPEKQLAGEAGFASFDMGRDPVKVIVTCDEDVHDVKLLPSSYGLKATFTGKTVTFTIIKPGQVTLEVNGVWNNSLHIFANPYEENVPKPGDPNVVYFGPGVHQIQSTTVKSGQTVYVAAGAVLYGNLSAGGKDNTLFHLTSNTVLRGRGIIDDSLVPKPSPGGNMVSAGGSDIRIEGVVLRDSPSWTVPIWAADGVKVDNIKIFGWRGNSDGVDISNSSNVDVSNCFFRTFDDNVVIKTPRAGGQPTTNIKVTKCVSWNEIAHPFSLGAELNVDCSNIVFSDCDVIHDKGREWVMRVYNSGAGHVSNVVFDNIRIEEARRPVSLWIGESMWVKLPGRGMIDGVVFSNISCAAPEGGHEMADIVGFDADHAVRDVTFKNFAVGGRPMALSDVKANDFAGGIKIEP